MSRLDYPHYHRNRSQALVEFTLILPILIVLICGAIDYGLLVYKAQVLAMLCRTGANTAYRLYNASTPQYSLARAVTNVVLAASPSANNNSLVNLSRNGAVILTCVTRNDTPPSPYTSNNLYYYLIDSTNPTNCVQVEPGMFGTFDGAANQSKLVVNNTWLDPRRSFSNTVGGTLVPSDWSNSQAMFVVEIYLTNSFITPAGFFLNILVPSTLYDIMING
jgi:Flp pilus assembly protein TadG